MSRTGSLEQERGRTHPHQAARPRDNAQFLLDLQASAGNRAVGLLVQRLLAGADALPAITRGGSNRLIAQMLGNAAPPTSARVEDKARRDVQRKWEMKYDLSGVSKADRKTARGNRHFFEKVGMTTVGLRADIGATKLGGGYASGGKHAEDELIEELTQLANDYVNANTPDNASRTPLSGAVLSPGNANQLRIRKLDATPCTSTPRIVLAKPRIKMNKKVKSKHGGMVTKTIWKPDRKKSTVNIPLKVVTSEKTTGYDGCTERLLELKRNGITVSGQNFGFSTIDIEADHLYQGGPGQDESGLPISIDERRKASDIAIKDLQNEPGMTLEIKKGYIGMGKGRKER